MTRVKLINQAGNPDTPAGGAILLFSKTDKKLYYIDDAGLVTGPLSAGSTVVYPRGTVESTVGALTASSSATSVLSGAANVKGNYYQLVASSPFAVTWVGVVLHSTTSYRFLVDIAVGGAGAEVVKIPNLCFQVEPENVSNSYLFPIAIPAGSRISARCQSDSATAYAYVEILLFNGGTAPADYPTQVQACGVVTASTSLTTITAGNANVKGAYAQLTAALTGECKFACLAVLGNYGTNAADFLIDIATGAALSEAVKVNDVYMRQAAAYSYYYGQIYQLPLVIATGVRVAARCQSSKAAYTLMTALYCAIP